MNKYTAEAELHLIHKGWLLFGIGVVSIVIAVGVLSANFGLTMLTFGGLSILSAVIYSIVISESSDSYTTQVHRNIRLQYENAYRKILHELETQKSSINNDSSQLKHIGLNRLPKE